MSDDLERELEALGRTLENQTPEAITPDPVVTTLAAPPKRKLAWVAVAAAIIAIAGAVGVALATRDDSTNIAAQTPEDPLLPESTTTPPTTTVAFSTTVPGEAGGSWSDFPTIPRPITQAMLNALVPDDVLAIDGTDGWGNPSRDEAAQVDQGPSGCDAYDSVNSALTGVPRVEVSYQNSTLNGIYLATSTYLFDDPAQAASISAAISNVYSCTALLCDPGDSGPCDPDPESRPLSVNTHSNGIETAGFSIGPVGSETFVLVTGSDARSGWLISVELEGGAYSPDAEREVREWLALAIDHLSIQALPADFIEPPLAVGPAETTVPTTQRPGPAPETSTTETPSTESSAPSTTYIEGPSTTLAPRTPITTLG